MPHAGSSLALEGVLGRSAPVAEDRAAVLRWSLRRNCSLAPCQLVIGLVVLCVPCVLIAAAFWAAGMVWVAPFAGLEVAAVGAALVVYARHARDGEWIELEGQRLRWQRIEGSTVENGEVPLHRLRLGAGRAHGEAVELLVQGRSLVIGRHAAPAVRERFAHEFSDALQRSRRTAPGMN
jgi:uncharacterized membrane protein